jgi:uncharacterized membrane protein YhiD involved in acid resistance
MAYESIIALGVVVGSVLGILSVVRTILIYVTNKKLKRMEDGLRQANGSLLDLINVANQESIQQAQPIVELPEMPEPVVRRPGRIIQAQPKPDPRVERERKEIEAKRKRLMDELDKLGK